MARIAVERATLERGGFAPVCCKSGQQADSYDTFEFSHTPGWTWALIPFGILPFLIATAFVTERFVGVLPFSAGARDRLAMGRRLVWVFGMSALLVGAAGLVAGGGWVLLGALLAAGWLMAIGVVWHLSPRAKLAGATVALSGVHPDFVTAMAVPVSMPASGLGDEDTDPGLGASR